MDDLISRAAAIDALYKMLHDCFGADDEELDAVITTLNDLPSAQPGRKTGRWIPQDYNKRNGYVTTTVYYYPKCSECGHSGDYSMNYCPSCGAFMGGGTE